MATDEFQHQVNDLIARADDFARTVDQLHDDTPTDGPMARVLRYDLSLARQRFNHAVEYLRSAGLSRVALDAAV